MRCSCLCGGERKNALFYWLECGHEKRTNIQLRRAKLSGMTSCGLASCTLLFYQNLCKFNHHHLVVLLLYLNTINNRDRNIDRERRNKRCFNTSSVLQIWYCLFTAFLDTFYNTLCNISLHKMQGKHVVYANFTCIMIKTRNVSN